MPELPEVETIRRELERSVVGRPIRAAEVRSSGRRSIRRHKGPKEFENALVGKTIGGVTRKGKYILMDLGKEDVWVVHLGMTGQLRLVKTKEPLELHTKVVVTLKDSEQLRFVDPRMFGETFVSSRDSVTQQLPELAHLGFDPLEDVITWAAFERLLRNRKAKLKALLMDQRFVAGIGNIYSDEILFAAGLRYDRDVSSLSVQDVRRLYRSMVEVLTEALRHRGSSLADERYRDLYGRLGEYQQFHAVYDREGKPCPRCRGTVTRQKVGGRSSYFCPRCQA